jgi:hypothetical protein
MDTLNPGGADANIKEGRNSERVATLRVSLPWLKKKKKKKAQPQGEEATLAEQEP